MKIRIGSVILLAGAVIACAPSDSPRGPGAGLAYPETRKDSATDVYHGTRVADPYRWLEQTSAPDVRAWAAAQNALMAQVVRTDSLRGWFLERMKHHSKVWDQLGDEETRVVVEGNEFIMSAAPGQALRLLRIKRAGSSDSARVFIDPSTFGAEKNLVRFQVSPDGNHVAYAISASGGEWVETRIRRVSDGADLPDVLGGMLGGVPLWSRDSRGLFYVHQRRGTDADRVMFFEPSVRYHAIGTPQASDRIVFATPAGSVESVLQISYASRGRYVIIAEGSGAVWEQFSWVLTRLHLLDLGDGPIPAVANAVTPLVADKIAGYQVMASEGPMLYVMTDRDAPRKRLVAIDVRDAAPNKWRDVIPQDSTLLLNSMRRINDRFVGVYLEDVQKLIRVFGVDGRLLQTFRLPHFANILELDEGEKDSELSVGTSSFLQPPTFTTYDVLTGKSRVVQALTGDFDTASYQMKQEWYASKDGTRVPMFIVHRKNIAMDGSHPVLLHGYGASGTLTLPEFTEDVLAWIEAGGVFAMPSLRGGGEFGRAWYEAAILDRKQNTFDDFIGAAEFLIRQGYTKPERIAIRGASNGGQLVAASLTQRPDLFGVAISEVPITDNLRYDRGRHRGQFGHVSDSTQFAYLYQYSPLHRVKPKTCYPATLVTTVLNDDRAPAWLAFKFAAALQSAQSCGKPVLLRVADAGGHLGDRGPNAWLDDAADVLAFAARQFGMRVPPATAR